MHIVETSRSASPVLGIAAAVVVPVELINGDTRPDYARLGRELITALESALSEGGMASATMTGHGARDLPRDAQALRPVATRPELGARTRRVHTALTRREREVLRLVADGLTNSTIASRLFISPKTASVHVSRILTKLDASTRTEAAALAHASGLMQPANTTDQEA